MSVSLYHAMYPFLETTQRKSNHPAASFIPNLNAIFTAGKKSAIL